MTWKEFKEWMEKQGVTDEMEFDGMNYDGDFEEMKVYFDKSFGDTPVIQIVYRDKD